MGHPDGSGTAAQEALGSNVGAESLAPTPPPMRLVTKGWWVLREKRATAEEIAAADRAQRADR